MSTGLTKFGNVGRVSPDVQAYVNSQIATAVQPLVAGVGPSITNGNTIFVDTTGKKVKCAPYTMPTTVGTAGQVLEVDISGNIVYGTGGGGNPFDQDLNTFNNVSFNSVTTANITGPTKVSVAGVDRLDITATETNLFSQNIGTGPTGTQLRLRNDNTFVLGTRFSDNGSIECNPNSMAIYGSEVKSAEILTNSSITKQLTNGTFRIDREIMTGTGQEFRDGNGFNRLNITNSDGVTINSAFSLPTTTGSVGDVLTRTGTSATTWTAPAAAPTYLPTLTVTSLSVGPSALVQNYTLPTRPPAPNQLILSVGSYVMDIPSTLPLQFRVNTISFGILGFGISFPINPTTPISEVLLTINEGIRSFFNGPLVNVVADIIMEYSNFGNRFGFRLLADTPTANFISFSLADNSPSNINNLFGNSLPPDPTPSLELPAPSFIIFPEQAIGVFITPECVWSDLRGIPVSAIQSDSGASSIQCEDVGVGQSGIVSYGNYNVNNGSINNCGNINALDNCNITTNTTQIENGLGELNISINSLPRITQDATKTKIECGTSALNLAVLSDGLSQDTTTYLAASNIGNTANISAVVLPDSYNVYQNNGAIQRLIVDDTKSALFSKNGVSGPAGSILELNNDNTFTLGCFAANNGIIECRPNSLALYGNTATTAITMTNLDIITSLGIGGRIDREILDTTSQSFRDPSGTERLRVDDNGVVINNTYQLTNNAGTSGQTLITNGAGQTVWQYPTKIQDSGNPSSFINCDSENIYVSTFYPTGKLQLGVQASISAGQVLTSTDTLGSAEWQTPQIYSIFSQIVDQTVVSTAAETTIIGGGTPTSTLTIPPNFFTAGMAFRYTTGGLFRTSANNISARFRLRNSGVLFDSGLLVFSNRVILATPWNVEATFAYMGGTVMVTNFNFSYNAGNDARGFTSQQSNNTFNATVSNTLNFTIQWSVSSADNLITTNFGVVQKIY
jgi:hypothetical protein